MYLSLLVALYLNYSVLAEDSMYKLFISLSIALLSLACTSCTDQSSPKARWYQRKDTLMGTIVQVEILSDNHEKAHTLISKVIDTMHRYEMLLSVYSADSEITDINNNAYATPVSVSPETFEIIIKSIEISRMTHGAFDITFESVGYLYNFRTSKAPTSEEVSSRLDAIDYRHVKTDANNRTISFTHPGVKINLGGIAKGYIVDKCIDMLINEGVQNAMVNAGGDSRILGDRNGRPWKIGIQDPRNKSIILRSINVENSAISTSGDYERFFEKDGIRYHHIINPSTGTSSERMRSVTIIGESATMTDALSTAIFVLGDHQGMILIESLSGFEAVLINGEGQLKTTGGLRR